MKTAILTGIVALMSLNVFACDICTVYLGLQPNDFKHRFGLQYRNRLLNGSIPVQQPAVLQLKHLESTGPAKEGAQLHKIRESYQVLDFRVALRLSPEWQLRTSLPVLRTDAYVDDSLNMRVAAVGDPWILLSRIILSSKQDSEQRNLNHRLQGGLGVKFPLGATTYSYEEESVPYDMQPGTGSYDLLLSLEYILRFKTLGLSASGVYKYNGKNLSDYRFGNTSMLTTQVFWLKNGEKSFFMPSLGLYYEWADSDRSYNEQLSDTGGDILFLGTGMELGSKRYSVNLGLQHALHDHIKNSTVPAQWRITAGLNFFI